MRCNSRASGLAFSSATGSTFAGFGCPWFALVLWLLFQIISAAQQLAGVTAVGLLGWLVWGKENPGPLLEP
jgi:hypothetical protein